MAVTRGHLAHHKDVFALPGILAEPALVFGYQELDLRDWPPRKPRYPESVDRIRRGFKRLRYRLDALRGAVPSDLEIPEEFRVQGFLNFLRQRGIEDVDVLDHYDSRAGLRFDMNLPVPPEFLARYATFIDIGCLEHVFDTRQCLENCLRMVKPGGHYFLHVPVNGYFGHGLHVFHPVALIDALELNGFEIVFERYSSRRGGLVQDPSRTRDALLWLVGRRVEADTGTFRIPEQRSWRQRYRTQDGPEESARAASAGGD